MYVYIYILQYIIHIFTFTVLYPISSLLKSSSYRLYQAKRYGTPNEPVPVREIL